VRHFIPETSVGALQKTLACRMYFKVLKLANRRKQCAFLDWFISKINAGNYNMISKVRKANLNDLEKIVEFIVAEAKDAEGISKSPSKILNGVKTGIENPNIARYWVLKNEKEDLVGCVSVVKEWSDWNCAFYWWIQSIYIRPSYRGKGLMEELLQEVKHAAKHEDAIELRLYVHRDNKRAIRAYQKAGFSDSDYNIMLLPL
jgi:L-amino acid N-acyltransferase YncA